MTLKTILATLLLSCTTVFCLSGRKGGIALTVHAGTYDRRNCIVSAEIPAAGDASCWKLSEQKGKKKTSVPSQTVQRGNKTVLYWILSGQTKANEVRTYIARQVKKQPAHNIMQVEDTQQALLLKKDGKTVLQYNYTHAEPPPGVNAAYRRSGFLHPVCSPAGNVLTGIQPKDHYHHYGIWNPWTHIVYDGKLYDLWNLGDKKGTVRAEAIKDSEQGAVFSRFDAALSHVIFTPDGEKVIMDEHWDVTAWNIPDLFLWDFESRLRPSTPLPVLIQAYRYAGFGYRATAEWTKDNCEMMTSEGKTRQEIDGTAARWIYITGDTKTGRSGLLFMGHPENRNAPEPLRIWDEKANGGRGDAFINFAPTKNKDWELEAGKQYVLRYRVLAYEGQMTSAQANSLWNDFAHPPIVKIK